MIVAHMYEEMSKACKGGLATSYISVGKEMRNVLLRE